MMGVEKDENIDHKVGGEGGVKMKREREEKI